MASFITDALNEQRKARETTQRLEMQADAAWAKEEAKIASAKVREQAKLDRQAAREREVAAGHAEAEAVTRALQTRLTELETLLASTLHEDPYVPFDQFKEPLILTEFRPPERLALAAPAPQESNFMPEPLSGPRALAPGRKRAYAADVADRQAEYEWVAAAHAQAEQRRRQQLAPRPGDAPPYTMSPRVVIGFVVAPTSAASSVTAPLVGVLPLTLVTPFACFIALVCNVPSLL